MDFGELISDAVSDAGVDPSSLTAEHLDTIRTSFKMLQIDIETAGGAAEFREHTVTLSGLRSGVGVLSLPDDAIDVLAVQVSESAIQCPGTVNLARTSRQMWTALSDRFSTGMPTSYWVGKSLPHDDLLITYHERVVPTSGGWGADGFGLGGWGTGGNALPANQADIIAVGTPILVLWPIADQEYTITVTYYRHHHDQGDMGDDVDAARNWLPTMSKGLAARFALKHNLERYALLVAEFKEYLQLRIADQDNAPVYVGFRGLGWSRRRRH